MGGGRQPAAGRRVAVQAWRLFAEDREAAASVTARGSRRSLGWSRAHVPDAGVGCGEWRSWATDVERRQDAALGALLRRIADRTRLLKAGAHAIRCLGDEADRACGPSVGRGFGGADSQGDGARRAASVAWVDVASVRPRLTLSGAAHLSARLGLLQHGS